MYLLSAVLIIASIGSFTPQCEPQLHIEQNKVSETQNTFQVAGILSPLPAGNDSTRYKARIRIHDDSQFFYETILKKNRLSFKTKIEMSTVPLWIELLCIKTVHEEVEAVEGKNISLYAP